jgi:RimJ/RimL family protein N-acetyltransferase
MNLQEQIQRIQKMMGLLVEDSVPPILEPTDSNESGLSVVYIPLSSRSENIDLLREISIACYGDDEKVQFTDKFSIAKVPGNADERVSTFTKFLMTGPKHLLVIKLDGKGIGFFNIINFPKINSIGFAINVDYSGKGIMTQVFETIKNDGNIQYPLYGGTLKNNEPSKKLMERLGFKKLEETEIHNHPIIIYVLNPNEKEMEQPINITEVYQIMRLITEDKSVNCICGHSWKLSDGGNDPYLCHKCGHDNSKTELTEKCWKGYTQKGMKTMFGKRYPNCVKKTK